MSPANQTGKVDPLLALAESQQRCSEKNVALDDSLDRGAVKSLCKVFQGLSFISTAMGRVKKNWLLIK